MVSKEVFVYNYARGNNDPAESVDEKQAAEALALAGVKFENLREDDFGGSWWIDVEENTKIPVGPVKGSRYHLEAWGSDRAV